MSDGDVPGITPNTAAYTCRLMRELWRTGRTAHWHDGTEKSKSRARGRIWNAARRLGVEVNTHTDARQVEAYLANRVVIEE